MGIGTVWQERLKTTDNLMQAHILVSNFKNYASTLRGLRPGGVDLTTALAGLRSGWVIVGSLPTSDGTSATAQVDA